jgi:hypothetical protein
MIRQVEYFEKPGKYNTTRCLDIVKGLVKEGFSHVVVATTGGETGLVFARGLQALDVNLVAVTHNVGFGQPNQDECSEAVRNEMLALGAKVYTGTILTRSIDYAFMRQHQGIPPSYVAAQTLRLFCQGMKVAAEIVAEACDAGLVPEGADVIAVAGTGRGADTVAIIEAHPSHRFLEIRFKQILAKPM